MKITFNAFGFLLFKLRENNIPCQNAILELKEEATPKDILELLGIKEEEVEGVFVNGKIKSFDTKLKDGDRVALVPPGTPGPYRHLLGIRDCKHKGSST
ncbi:MAG: ThiamineS protein [Desulfonauticus sp. 38_4375]|nr:MAG: ThiamineS protein [Desulfonauticus sp. 38_4375]